MKNTDKYFYFEAICYDNSLFGIFQNFSGMSLTLINNLAVMSDFILIVNKIQMQGHNYQSLNYRLDHNHIHPNYYCEFLFYEINIKLTLATEMIIIMMIIAKESFFLNTVRFLVVVSP